MAQHVPILGSKEALDHQATNGRLQSRIDLEQVSGPFWR